MTEDPPDGIGIPADSVNGGASGGDGGREGQGGSSGGGSGLGSGGGGEMPPGERTQAALKVPYREREESVTSSEMAGLDPPIAGTELEPDAELLTINIGPHHPATHGVLRLLCTLEGETVLDLEPIIGYVHTGIEKSCEDQEYWKAITFVERMDYLAYYFNAYAFCSSVEALLGEEVPPRAQYLRVIHMELNRIASHLFWLGTAALDIGAMSMLWWSLRERDGFLDLFEMSSGQRLHTRYFQVGGVIEDIPPGFEDKARKIIAGLPARIDQYEALLDRNEIWLQRMKNTGIVSKEDMLGLGVTGPLLRATGHSWDLRKAMPYCSYEHFDFKVPVGSVGDNYDRYRVRLEEMRESVKIVEQALDGLPEGPFITTNRKVALPPRHELATSMEALIHHFKLVTEGFRVPPGEVYKAVESPRGELGCFVVADGSAKPARVHMRDPSFVNLQSLKKMGEGSLIADFIACVAMLDPILGGVDR
jgi:NADH-quinone oxidoreductase subunit D